MVSTRPAHAPPVVVAHRGASALAPENTLLAYSTAIQRGADMVELDVHLTRDGRIVCIHDATVDRTTDGTGEVSSLGFGELRRLSAGEWFYGGEVPPSLDPADLRVPELAEVIALVRGRCRLLVEIKGRQPELTLGVVRALREADMLSNGAAVLQSFDEGCVRAVASLAPESTRLQLTPEGFELGPEAVEEVASYASGIACHESSVTPELVRMSHERGLLLFAYTVNDAARMRALMRLGLDGIITDECDRLAALVHETTPRGA